MIDRPREMDTVELLIAEFGQHGTAPIPKSQRRSMPVGSHTTAKAGRRRCGKRSSIAKNGAHRRFRRRSLFT